MAIDIERYIGKYANLLIQSFNPGSYHKLTQNSAREIIGFVGKTLLVGVVLFLITFIPVSYLFINQLPERLEKVDVLELNGELIADEPVQLMSYPSIIINTNSTHEGLKNADLVVTREGVVYPEYILFGSEFVSWSEMTDLKEPTPQRNRMLAGLVVFLLPSIMFWYFFLSLIELVIVFCTLLLLGFALPRLFKHRMRPGELLKASMFAMSPVILIGVGLSPLAPRPLFWWGFLLSLGIFLLAVAMLSERVSRR